MIRSTIESETELLKEIARGTLVFRPMEIHALGEGLDDFHALNRLQEHKAITLEMDSQAIGFAYYAPTPMTDRTWHLYWIFVDKKSHAKGIGTEILNYVEQDIIHMGGRLLVIETSSLPSYVPTRRFYLKHGYEQAATIRDFYTEGDDQVIFRKRLLPVTS